MQKHTHTTYYIMQLKEPALLCDDSNVHLHLVLESTSVPVLCVVLHTAVFSQEVTKKV